VQWKTTRIIRDVADVRWLKEQPGKNIHAVGGATLVSSLMNEHLIDEIWLTVHPIVLGQGKALFKDVRDRHRLEFAEAKPLPGGRLNVLYRTQPAH
jgi:dihydrofolate reductase